MKTPLKSRLIATSLACAASLAGCATNTPPQYSGFIKNVPPLAEEKDDAGITYRYTVPKLISYCQVLLDPVQLYPEPEPSEQIDMATLRGIRSYLDQALRTKIATRGDLAYAPGPKIARVRVALTSVTAESAALKPYQYIPLALPWWSPPQERRPARVPRT